MNPLGIPGRHNGLNTRLQLDNTNQGVLIKMCSLDIEQLRPSCKAICRVVESVEDLDCRTVR